MVMNNRRKKSGLLLGALLIGGGLYAMNEPSENGRDPNLITPPSANWEKDIPKFGDYPEGHIKESFIGSDLTRTLSNGNNAGNIAQFRTNGNVINPNDPWKGSVSWQYNTDGRFVQFISFAWGLRASILLLKNYIDRDGRDTITKIIQYWDLGNPNYINHLVTNTGFQANQTLQADKATLKNIIRYIVVMEHGWSNDLVTDKRFETAYNLL